MKTPISVIIDDPAPLVFVFNSHSLTHKTLDGRTLPDTVPVEFLEKFCDVTEKRGIRGKFSIVPVPGCVGRIDRPMPGIDDAQVRRWIAIANARVSKNFDFCAELVTHHNAWDIVNEVPLDIREDDWAATQTEDTLTDYITYALTVLKNAGITAGGITSPWALGDTNERNYSRAIGRAMENVYGVKDSWYFLWSNDKPHARPQVVVNENGRRVVSISRTIEDHIWQTMDTTETSAEYVSRIADNYITADGSRGAIIDTLNKDSWPILCTHWQSLFSTGKETGLRVLDTVGERVNKNLSQAVEWTRFDDLMRMVL